MIVSCYPDFFKHYVFLSLHANTQNAAESHVVGASVFWEESIAGKKAKKNRILR